MADVFRTTPGRIFVLSMMLSGAACSRNDSGAGAGESARATPEAAPQTASPKGGEPVNADAQAMASFVSRVTEYVALHRKLEDQLPKLKKEATPHEIDKHQRALAQLVQDARKDAKPGDIFTPEAQVVIKALMVRVFGGPDGRALLDSIMDENPGPMKLTINKRYPDTVPLSTVPPQVLQGLPKLPEETEYRFIGSHLILMDVHAHLIADVVENVLPH